MSLWSAYTQLFPPNPPTLTEANLPSQEGKVFLVTGGSSGIGRELCRILYAAGARVYLATRSPAKATAAIEHIRALVAENGGELLPLSLDLADLSTVRIAASWLISHEHRLDVLWNNAGVGGSPGLTAQGFDLHLGVNCIGPLLLTQLLHPLLCATGSSARVVWTSSWICETPHAPSGGIDFDHLESPPPGVKDEAKYRYAVSKVGNWMLAVEGSRRWAADGIMHVAQNPGNVNTSIWSEAGLAGYLLYPFLREPRYGAYTALFAGLAQELNQHANRTPYVIPWGRIHPAPPADIVQAMKREEDGGHDAAARFWVWCAAQADRVAAALGED